MPPECADRLAPGVGLALEDIGRQNAQDTYIIPNRDQEKTEQRRIHFGPVEDHRTSTGERFPSEQYLPEGSQILS